MTTIMRVKGAKSIGVIYDGSSPFCQDVVALRVRQ